MAGVEGEEDLEKEEEWNLSSNEIVLIVGVGVVMIIAPPRILYALGFTKAGVAAGSIASYVQSVVYGGSTSGLFSLLQSLGAKGVAVKMALRLAGATATVGTPIAVRISLDSAWLPKPSFIKGTSLQTLLKTALPSPTPVVHPNATKPGPTSCVHLLASKDYLQRILSAAVPIDIAQLQGVALGQGSSPTSRL